MEEKTLVRVADEARRRVDAHASGVGSLVVVHDPLVVAAERERENVGSGDDGHRRGFHAGEAVLDHDALAGGAEGAGKHLVDGFVGVVDVVGDDDALAGGEAVGLEHGQIVGAEDFEPLMRGLGGLEEFAAGVGHARRLHDLLGEPLRGFDLRRIAAGTERQNAAFSQRINEAGGERRFGADDDEVDAALDGGVADGGGVGVVDVEVLAEFGSSGVAGRCEDSLAAWRLHQFPGQRVLASAAADNQDSHEARLSDGGRQVGRETRRNQAEITVEHDRIHGQHFRSVGRFGDVLHEVDGNVENVGEAHF